ncbi:hypothetical protein BC937DRAFT_95547 [Endogone sp. FLAS-F59071]|nr:hypothetical protein BC937DRAFT_95547 [Endogone sp. FLAS-F59071]|eukprot:RUS20284.1 hypothetical protein BC937DRAFT_95547 [Endogone sp. FLAS-F59071]
MIEERRVLLRVEQFEQSRGWVTLVTAANLVDLSLDNLTRHGANIGATVPLDLGHVCQAANAESIKLAVERASNALADGSLTNARRTNQTEDFALNGAAKLAHGDELENTLLDILQAVVILVKNANRVTNIVILGRAATPRDLSEPVKIVSCHIEFGGGGLEMRKLIEFLVEYMIQI